MYYDEKMINGIWFFKTSPDGEWKPMNILMLSEKYNESKNSAMCEANSNAVLANVRAELKAASWEADNWSRVVDLDTVYKILSEHFSSLR